MSLRALATVQKGWGVQPRLSCRARIASTHRACILPAVYLWNAARRGETFSVRNQGNVSNSVHGVFSTRAKVGRLPHRCKRICRRALLGRGGWLSNCARGNTFLVRFVGFPSLALDASFSRNLCTSQYVSDTPHRTIIALPMSGHLRVISSSCTAVRLATGVCAGINHQHVFP